MPTEVKICGLSDEESVDAALAAGADLVGFVFFARSPRNIGLDRAAALAARARGKAAIVALTVDAGDAALSEIAATLRPDLLQLHGRETPERVAFIRAENRRPVMKVVGVSHAEDLTALAAYDAADRFLLDAKPPRDATRPGGNGAPFDWAVLADFSSPKPWFLSGGLTPANVAAAVQATGAAGVDVSSGVESAPGRKDPALIHAFVAAVRGAERAGAAHRLNATRFSVNVSQAPNTYRTGPDERGRFGLYGGRFVAETLMPLILDLEQAYEAAKADPAFQAELTHLGTHYTGPAEPALFRRAADGASSRGFRSLRAGRRRQDLFQARRAQPHRLAQDQQLPRPDPARPPHGQDAHHRRDRRRPARRRRRHGLRRASACPASSIWAPPTSSGRSRTSFA